MERESNVGLAAPLPSQMRWPYSLKWPGLLICCPDSESSPVDSEVCLHTLSLALFL